MIKRYSAPQILPSENVLYTVQTLPDFLHMAELISRTSAHDNIQEPSQHPSSGLIIKSSILEEKRYKSIEGQKKTIVTRQYMFLLKKKFIWQLNLYLMNLSVMKAGL